MSNNKLGLICTYCFTGIMAVPDADYGVCPTCQAPYHVDCWNANHGCAVLGCNSMNSDSALISVKKAGAQHLQGNRQDIQPGPEQQEFQQVRMKRDDPGKIGHQPQASTTTYFEDGSFLRLADGTEYYRNGSLKRACDGAEYYENGSLKRLPDGTQYYENGSLKRLPDGTEYSENWMLKPGQRKS